MPTPAAASQRRFSVHGLAETPSRGQMIEGLNFEDAALHFVEAHHLESPADEAVSLIVEDCETGERQCFTVDLETGDAAPCE